MNFLELAKARYSMRKFSSEQIKEDDLKKILEAGRLAPTAVNFQPQRVLVIQGEDARTRIKKCTKFHFNAPTFLFVCYDSRVCWQNKYTGGDSGQLDCAIVATHMMLEATELGLGSTFVADFDPVSVVKEFNMPSFLHPVVLLPTGHPTEGTAPHKWHSLRKDLSETVFRDSFEDKVKE